MDPAVAALAREVADLQRQIRAAVAREGAPADAVEFRLGRILPDRWPTSTTTSSTTSTSSTTTTPPACSVRSYNVEPIDAQFPLTSGAQLLTTLSRSSTALVAAAALTLALAEGDIVGMYRVNACWFIVAKFCNCPQASSQTTTTTTSTTTTPPT